MEIITLVSLHLNLISDLFSSKYSLYLELPKLNRKVSKRRACQARPCAESTKSKDNPCVEIDHGFVG